MENVRIHDAENVFFINYAQDNFARDDKRDDNFTIIIHVKCLRKRFAQIVFVAEEIRSASAFAYHKLVFIVFRTPH